MIHNRKVNKTHNNDMNTLQTKLARLESQLKITKGNRAKAKIVIEILKVESAIEWIEKKQAFKDEFYRKPEKTINKFKDTQINITETQAIELRTKQLELNLFCEMPCVNKFQEVDNTKFTKQTISILNKEGKTRKVKGEALGDYLISAGGNDAYCIYHIPTGLKIMSSVGFKTRNPVKYENLSEKEAARLAVKKLVAANIDIPGSYLEWNKSSAIEKAKIGQNIIDAFDDKIKAKAS